MSADIKELALKVADALGDSWSIDREWVELNNPNSVIVHEDGRKLWLSLGWKSPGYLTVHAIYPYRPGQYVEPGDRVEINVRADRGAGVIAREITRRLMPHCDERYAKVIKANEVAADHRKARDAMVGMVYAHLGDREPINSATEHARQGDGSRDVSLYSIGNLYGHVRVSSDGRRLDLDINGVKPETGLKILRLLVADES